MERTDPPPATGAQPGPAGHGTDDETQRRVGPVSADLRALGDRRELRIGGLRITGRRRRPSGEPVPLPHGASTGARWWWGIVAVVFGFWLSWLFTSGPAPWWDSGDAAIVGWLEERRTSAGITVATWFQFLVSDGALRVIRVAMLVALAVARRWRHFFAFILAILLIEIPLDVLQDAIARIRPKVEILGDWDGPAHPSLPLASFSVMVMVVGLVFVADDRWRSVTFIVGGIVTAAIAVSGVYLGVDHPSDALASMLLAPGLTFLVFRWFAPRSVFPVRWHRTSTAHLEIDEARAQAIRAAVRDQVGVEVTEITPISGSKSGGSTPLILGTDGERSSLFAKLYSQTHLSSDRWYKLARSLLYGDLEDEVRYTSVRRLVEHEDYVQRVMRDCGVTTPEPIGVVELTPGREYLFVTEFLEGAVELRDVDPTPTIIDSGLQLVRAMWDAGMAHRDIKPANVMVLGEVVFLVDNSFGAVRPSPWRQAVDLANMMLILALRSDAETVYQRALRQFAPADIAEAFAATRSVTIPRQTRQELAGIERDDGVDLVERFEQLSPHRERISIQRWTARRIARIVAIVVVVVLAAQVIWSELAGRGFL